MITLPSDAKALMMFVRMIYKQKIRPLKVGFFILKRLKIVRRGLIYEIVEPVYEKQASVRSPTNNRTLFGIVVAVIVNRGLDRQACRYVTAILGVKSESIVFRVSHYKELSAAVARHDVNSNVVA